MIGTAPPSEWQLRARPATAARNLNFSKRFDLRLDLNSENPNDNVLAGFRAYTNPPDLEPFAKGGLRAKGSIEPPKRQKAFDLLVSVAVFARKNDVKLGDLTLVDRFIADAAPRLREAPADPALIHG